MIIKSKKELKSIIDEEKKSIFGNKNITLETKFRSGFKFSYFQYLCTLRTCEYLGFICDNSSFFRSKYASFLIKLNSRKLNKLSLKINVDFVPGCIEKNVKVYHPNVVLNGIVGENCIFHGNNVLGNKGTGSKEIPVLGNNIDVGVGAIIIGGVTIADDCIIGAGSVVTKSFTEKGSVIAGVPAIRIR